MFHCHVCLLLFTSFPSPPKKFLGADFNQHIFVSRANLFGFIWNPFDFCLGSCMHGSCKQQLFAPLPHNHQYQSPPHFNFQHSPSSTPHPSSSPSPPSTPAPHHHPGFSHLSLICAPNVHLCPLSSETYVCFTTHYLKKFPSVTICFKRN